MDRAIKIFNKIMEFSLCGLIFFLPFSKAGLEIWLHLGLLAWFLKRIIMGIHNYKNSHKLKNFFKVFRVVPSSLNKPIYLLAIISFTSCLAGVNIALSLEGLFGKLYTYFFIYFLVLEVISCYDPCQPQDVVINPRIFWRVLAVLLFSIVIMTIDGWFQFFTGKDFMRGYSGVDINRPRLRASFKSPNNFAAWIITIFPLLFVTCFYKFKKINKMSKWAIRFFFIILTASAIFLLGRTFSRGAWLGCFLSMVFICIIGSISNSKKLKFFAIFKFKET